MLNVNLRSWGRKRHQLNYAAAAMRLLHPIRVRRWYDDDVVITSPGHSASSNLRIHGDQRYIQIFRKLTVRIRQRTYSRLVDSILVRLSSGVNKRRGRVPVSTPVAGIWSVGSIQGTRLRSVPDIDYRIRDSLVTDNLRDSAVPFVGRPERFNLQELWS